jgi:hypothetical protein
MRFPPYNDFAHIVNVFSIFGTYNRDSSNDTANGTVCKFIIIRRKIELENNLILLSILPVRNDGCPAAAVLVLNYRSPLDQNTLLSRKVTPSKYEY